MKKIICLFLILISIISCKKETSQEFVSVNFSYQIIEANSMVKTKVVRQEIIDIIYSKLPDEISFSLKSKETGISYTCNTKESKMLPLGDYIVTYKSNEPIYQTCTSPTFKINQEISVTKDSKNIILNATYTCFAIIVDLEKINSISTNIGNRQVNLVKFNTTGITFIPNTWNGNKISDISFILYVDNNSNYEQTTFRFTETYNKGCVLFEYGKYYIISPSEVTKSSTSFEIKYPEFIEGEI